VQVSKLPSKVAGYNDCAIAAKQKECKDTSTSTASTSTSAQDKQASNLRHMLIAMSEDWRYVLQLVEFQTVHLQSVELRSVQTNLLKALSVQSHNTLRRSVLWSVAVTFKHAASV
jgi:hypothetical protein